MSARTDIHAPSTFAPGDYKAVAYGDLSIQRPGFPEWERLLREAAGAHQARRLLLAHLGGVGADVAALCPRRR